MGDLFHTIGVIVITGLSVLGAVVILGALLKAVE